MKQQHLQYIQRAIDLAIHAMDENHGGPFGALVVKNGVIIGEGYNQVLCVWVPFTGPGYKRSIMRQPVKRLQQQVSMITLSTRNS